MKQFIASIYIVIIFFCGLTFERQSRIQLENKGNITGHSTSEPILYSTNFYDISNLAVNNESNQSLITHLLSFSHKNPFGNLSTKRSVELTNNNKISVYLYIAKCHVVQFEGPDIIHPFNYFW